MYIAAYNYSNDRQRSMRSPWAWRQQRFASKTVQQPIFSQVQALGQPAESRDVQFAISHQTSEAASVLAASGMAAVRQQ